MECAPISIAVPELQAHVTALGGASQACFLHCCYRPFTKKTVLAFPTETRETSFNLYEKQTRFQPGLLGLNKFLKLQLYFCSVNLFFI